MGDIHDNTNLVKDGPISCKPDHIEKNISAKVGLVLADPSDSKKGMTSNW